MGVIIGGLTTVSFPGGYCVVSAQWAGNSGRQDIYCLGQFTPNTDFTIFKPTNTASITIYAPGDSVTVAPSKACEVAPGINISIAPQGCDGGGDGGASGDYQVTGYSFSKDDVLLPGQESWSLTQWPGAGTSPKYILRGMATGTSNGDCGVAIDSTGSSPTSAGSVSAGGIGRSDAGSSGIVTSVGGGAGVGGSTGQGQASIPYTPLYI